MQARTSSRVSEGYSSRTSSIESPAPRNSKTVWAVMRVPLTTGRPLQTAGSMVILSFTFPAYQAWVRKQGYVIPRKASPPSMQQSTNALYPTIGLPIPPSLPSAIRLRLLWRQPCRNIRASQADSSPRHHSKLLSQTPSS